MSAEKVSPQLVEKRKLAGGFWWFELEFKNVFNFKAGQYISVKVSDKGEMRAYSIATVPGGKKIGLLVDVSPGGVGSSFFLNTKVGETIEALGPLGRFVVEKTSRFRPVEGLLFVATGSGIVPVKPMIEDLLKNKKYKGKVKLFWGLRFEEDVFWREEFKKIEERHLNFKLHMVLSKPNKHWVGGKGRVTDLLDEMESLHNWHVYLCGGTKMVNNFRESLSEKNVQNKDVYFEKYG